MKRTLAIEAWQDPGAPPPGELSRMQLQGTVQALLESGLSASRQLLE